MRDAAVLLIAALACAPVGWYGIYSRMPLADDETFFLLPIRLVADGGRLYDQVFNSYGPFYFDVFASFTRLFGVITHDRGRLIVLILWLASSVLCGVAVRRLSGSPWLGAAAVAAEFTAMSMLVFEPMNPGALLNVLLFAIVAISTAGRSPRTVAMIGALGGAAALTKLNVGGYVLVSVLVAVVLSGPRRPRLEPAIGVAAFAVVPVLVAIRDYDVPAVRAFIATTVLAGAVVWLTAARTGRRDAARNAALAPLFVAAAVTAFLVSAFTMAAFGSSAAGVVDGILIEPIRVSDSFKAFPRIGLGPPLALAAVAALAWALFGSALRIPRLRLVRALVRIGAGVWLLGALLKQGFAVSDMTPLWLGMATAWLVVLPDPRGAACDERTRFARLLLAALAVLLPLYAYPVAGSQAAFGAAPLAAVATVLLADGARAFKAELGDRLPAGGRLQLAGIAVALACLWFGPGASYSSEYHRYLDGNPLPYRGAEDVRVDAGSMARLEWLTTRVTGCRQLVTVPGLSAAYWFSGIAPPTFLPQVWMKLLSDRRQEAVIRLLRREPRSCALVDTHSLGFWLGGSPPRGPLVDYLHRAFRETAQFPYAVGGGPQNFRLILLRKRPGF